MLLVFRFRTATEIHAERKRFKSGSIMILMTSSLYEEKSGKGVFEAAEVEVVYNGDGQQQITITDNNYTLYSLSVCLLAKSLQLMLETNL